MSRNYKAMKIPVSVQVNQYPWIAALANTDEFFYCGGTLVGSEWVVTAAHCVFQDRAMTVPTSATDMRIVLGEHDKKSTRAKLPRKAVAVAKIVPHPNFNTKTFENDIAMVKLAEAVDVTVYTPACVASKEQDSTGKEALVYGETES